MLKGVHPLPRREVRSLLALLVYSHYAPLAMLKGAHPLPRREVRSLLALLVHFWYIPGTKVQVLPQSPRYLCFKAFFFLKERPSSPLLAT